MASLRNKVVVITGASSGIGKATAVEFARKGAKIVLAARREEKLKELQEYINKFNKNCLVVKTDVTSCKDIINLFDKTEDKFKKVDILINNAGRGLKGCLIDLDSDECCSTIQTNVNGVILCTQQAAKRMVAKKVKGHIITISSLAGLINIPNYSAYCSTKHAVTSFNRCIKWELLKHNIKVSTIHPYKVNTEFFNIYKKRPGRSQMLSPKDLADYIIAVASRNPLKTACVRTINICKRFYYFFRYM